MALRDTQVRQLKAKLEGKHVKTRKANELIFTMWKDGTSSPKQPHLRLRCLGSEDIKQPLRVERSLRRLL